MTRRRRPVAAGPVLVGAVTVLTAVVAVFLAYNANSGLPFVPTYTVRAEVPSAANLVVGNDVRMGGARIGAVHAIRPARHADGSVTALLELRLDADQAPLPADTTVIVRPRSVLGLKYVELARGTSAAGLADGARLPLRAARPQPVELDEVLGAFDAPTRRAAQTNLRAFGDALAGRGTALNATLGTLDPLLAHLEPAMRNLASPRTGLEHVVPALRRTAAEVAPVAEAQAGLARGLDTTFAALAREAPALRAAIAGAPPALEEAIASLPRQRPFLANAEGLFAELRPGARALRGGAGDLARAVRAGTGSLRRSTALSRRLEPAFAAVRRLAEDPLARLGVRGLTHAATLARPTLAHVTPAQTVCNYATLLLRNASSLLSVGDRNGTWQRFIIIAAPQGPDNEGGPSARPAAGPGRDNFLHANPYPNTAAPGQPRECEAGNEPYAAGRQVLGTVPGTQAARTERTTAEAKR